jgi:hypothetical protein
MKDDCVELCVECGKCTRYRCDLCNQSRCYRHLRHPHVVVPGTTQRSSRRSDLCGSCLAWSEREAKYPQPLPRWLRNIAPDGEGLKWN